MADSIDTAHHPEDEVEFEIYVLRTNGGKHVEIVLDSEQPLTAEEYMAAIIGFVTSFDKDPKRIFDCDPPFSGMN